jgi:hypothetical protein
MYTHMHTYTHTSVFTPSVSFFLAEGVKDPVNNVLLAAMQQVR